MTNIMRSCGIRGDYVLSDKLIASIRKSQFFGLGSRQVADFVVTQRALSICFLNR